MPKKRAKGRAAEEKGEPEKTSNPSTSRSPQAVPAKKSGSEARRRWTFLTNHSHVLILLNAEPDLALREIAARVGITERAIQQILSDLEEEGFIEREKVGRRNHYRVKSGHPLRHPIESHCSTADLLALILDHPDAKKNAWL